MPVLFDNDDTEHTAEATRLVEAAKAENPPITNCTKVRDYVLRNSTIEFQNDVKGKKKLYNYIYFNFSTEVRDYYASWHKGKTPASPLDELILPVLLVGTLTVIAYYSCMRQNTYFGPSVRHRSTISFAPDAMESKTDEEKDKAARDAALFETLVCMLMHKDHKNQAHLIKGKKLRKRVMKEVKKRIAAKGVVARIQGGARKRIGPGMRLTRDGKKIEVPWSDGGVRRVQEFDYDTAGRLAAADFVLKNCGRAVRLAQLEANRKAKAANQPLPYPIGRAVVDTYAGRATELPGFNAGSSSDSSSDDDDEEMRGAPDDDGVEEEEEEEEAAPRPRPRRARDDDSDVGDAASLKCLRA